MKTKKDWFAKLVEEDRRAADARWRSAIAAGLERGRCPYLSWNGSDPICRTRQYIDHCRPGTDKCVLMTTLARTAEMMADAAERAGRPVAVRVFVSPAPTGDATAQERAS